MALALLIALVLVLPDILPKVNVGYTGDYILNENLIEQVKEKTPNYVEYNKLPVNLIVAVTSTEDKRFFQHDGYDILAISRAFVNDIKAKKLKEGGSTITQQLVKNMFLSREKTLNRKLKELVLATKIEKLYSKMEILEIYLNVIYYGDGKYGVGDASINYFEKEIWNLDFEECATIAGIPQSSNRYNPKKYPEKAEIRKQLVLKRIEKNINEPRLFNKFMKIAKIYPKMKIVKKANILH